jgi:hypothetical protein
MQGSVSKRKVCLGKTQLLMSRTLVLLPTGSYMAERKPSMLTVALVHIYIKSVKGIAERRPYDHHGSCAASMGPPGLHALDASFSQKNQLHSSRGALARRRMLGSCERPSAAWRHQIQLLYGQRLVVVVP